MEIEVREIYTLHFKDCSYRDFQPDRHRTFKSRAELDAFLTKARLFNWDFTNYILTHKIVSEEIFEINQFGEKV